MPTFMIQKVKAAMKSKYNRSMPSFRKICVFQYAGFELCRISLNRRHSLFFLSEEIDSVNGMKNFPETNMSVHIMV